MQINIAKTPMNLPWNPPWFHGKTRRCSMLTRPGKRLPKNMERSTIFWCVNQLFRLGHGFKFAFCNRLPGRVNSKIFPGFWSPTPTRCHDGHVVVWQSLRSPDGAGTSGIRQDLEGPSLSWSRGPRAKSRARFERPKTGTGWGPR